MAILNYVGTPEQSSAWSPQQTTIPQGDPSSFDWGNVAKSAIPDLAGGALSAVGNMITQGFTNAHNERLMREGWDRDDNKYQRTVKDLRSAGLNPMLAVNGGQTSPSNPIQTTAPDVSGFGKGVSNAAIRMQTQIGLENAKASVSNTYADNMLKQAQANMYNAQAESMRGGFINHMAGAGAFDSTRLLNDAQRFMHEYNLGVSKDEGWRTNFGPQGFIAGTLDYASKAGSSVFNRASNTDNPNAATLMSSVPLLRSIMEFVGNTLPPGPARDAYFRIIRSETAESSAAQRGFDRKSGEAPNFFGRGPRGVPAEYGSRSNQARGRFNFPNAQ